MGTAPPPPSSHHQCITTLKGHSSYISTLTLHGTSLFSGSSDNQIRIWSTPSFDHCQIITSNSPIKSLVISGHTLFTSHHDHKIRAWQLNNNHHKLIAVLPTSKDRLLTLLKPDSYVQIRRHKRCTWVHHVDAVSGLAVSRNGSLLYSVSWDRTLKIWRTSDFRCVESVGGAHQDAINAVAVSEDGFVYTGSADSTVKVWKRAPDRRKHVLVETLDRHRSAVNALALTADGHVLYSGACDRSVLVWERASPNGQMAVRGALRGHGKAVLCLAVAGDLVCSGSADRTVRVWRREGEEVGWRYTCVAVMEGKKGSGPVKSLAMGRADGGDGGNGSVYYVYSGSLECDDIKVWKVVLP